MRLENKVALISGGARGMGAAEAKLFAKEGAKVGIGDVLDEDGRRTEAEINELGGDCVFVHLDVTDEEQWRNAVNEAVSRFGKLDILVNNAGIYRTNTVLETSADEWDQSVGRLYQMDDLDSVSSLTLFGGMGEAVLNQEEEIKKIHSAVGLGLIDEDEERALRSVVGRDPQQVRMLLRQTAFA